MKNGDTFKAELYYQVMKQLLRNPSRASMLKGWEMMTLLLTNFAPPKDIENVVALFLRKQAPPEIVHNCRCALYSIMYATPKTAPPTLEEISTTTKGFSRIEFDERFLIDDFIVVKEVSALQPSAATVGSGYLEPSPSRQASRNESPTSTTVPAMIKSPAAPPAPPAPPPLPPPTNPTARALYAFAADGPDKMTLVANEVYEILDDSSEAWWLVLSNGTQGWAPGSYLQKL